MKKEDQKKSEKEQQESQDLPEGNNAGGTEEEHPMVALTFDEFDAMEQKIENLQAEVEKQQDQYLRTRADFENYKKRVLRDASRSYQDAMSSAMKIFLSVADDLERALKNSPEGEEIQSWLNGIELIQQKLMNQMKNQGVERLDIHPGDEFDPNIHEAITQEDNPDFEGGQIIEVVQPGYKISDRIIRPAMVRVAR